MRKVFLVLIAVVCLAGCYWSPLGAAGPGVVYRDGVLMTPQEAEKYAEEHGKLNNPVKPDAPADVTITIVWPQ